MSRKLFTQKYRMEIPVYNLGECIPWGLFIDVLKSRHGIVLTTCHNKIRFSKAYSPTKSKKVK